MSNKDVFVFCECYSYRIAESTQTTKTIKCRPALFTYVKASKLFSVKVLRSIILHDTSKFFFFKSYLHLTYFTHILLQSETKNITLSASILFKTRTDEAGTVSLSMDINSFHANDSFLLTLLFISRNPCPYNALE